MEFLVEVFWACTIGKRPKMFWRDYFSWLAYERFGIPQKQQEKLSGAEAYRGGTKNFILRRPLLLLPIQHLK